MGTVIRDATATDAAAIAGIHVRSWQSAYRGMIDDVVLDGLSVARRASDWTERGRSTGGSGSTTMVAGRGSRAHRRSGCAHPWHPQRPLLVKPTQEL
jgi:hypothetical protein